MFVLGMVANIKKDLTPAYTCYYSLAITCIDTENGIFSLNEPRREKTGFLLMRKQRRRSALR